MSAIKHVLIVGGGIGGLSAAIALRKSGVVVDIVEISPQAKVYHVGIVVQANCIRAMAQLGIADAAVAAGFPYKGLRICNQQGEVKAELSGARLAGEQYPANLGLTRPALHQVLLDAVAASGANLRLGLTFSDISQHEHGVSVGFTDGSRGDYDLVVGADGARPPTRR